MESEKIEKITADSIDECKARLNESYGLDWIYKGHRQKIINYGLFNLRKKYVYELSYSVGHKRAYSSARTSEREPSEDEKYEKNRQDLIIATQTAMITKKLEEMESKLTAQIASKTTSSVDKPESIQKIEDMLYQNDFSQSYIKEISEKIRSNFSLEQLENYDLVEHKVVDWIGESISVAKPQVHRPPHVVIIVGPTGVGKTTTLVKLAAQFVFLYKKDERNQGRKPRICFIMTDFLRVGAMQQLERYGELMRYQVLKAEKTEDLKTIYEENKENMDAIFIDTSGCSPNDAAHIATIKTLLDIPQMRPDVYLAVTASSKSRDLQNIFKNYEPFGYNSVIVTKCDESNQYGNVISVLNEKHKSVSYVTTGQNVAHDLAKANVVDFLIRLESFNIDRAHIEDKFGEQ